MQLYILTIIIGYFIGSIPFSYLISKKTAHLDLREHGSGNLGSTNVTRVAGKKAGLVAFVLDLSKGILSYLIGYYLLGITGAVLCTGMTIIGHCYSIFMKFRGGKGVATTYGILLMFNPILAITLFVIQVLIVKVSKLMSLGSIMAAIFIPILGYFFNMEIQFIYLGIFLAIFIPFRHKDNIKRLLSGTENKFKI
ncbi:MAG: glycerol-3-phosphate 1-O-acyltransferase PlsY [Clostridiales bacterium]|nr:glycerol-3-phosphate 1-O-acyltransferase PlsY [Clostridiales bacterium]